MGGKKSRMANSSISISFTNDICSFDVNHPITGTIRVDSKHPIAAYGIQLKLELIDMSRYEIKRGKDRSVFQFKRKVWERCEMLYCFQNNMMNVGE